jgi:TM2 domain-containing membrane protein YozV
MTIKILRGGTMQEGKKQRRSRAVTASYNTNMLQLRNPWVIVWWSAAFPGLGHMMLGSHLKGILLILWEVLVNTKAHLNLAIIYSFTGNFDAAREVADQRWLLAYTPTYLYAMWNSYRATVEINKLCILSYRENPPITPFRLGPWEINFLDKRTPWVAAFWSLIMPGTGHLYTHRLVTGFFLLIWWIGVMYQANLLPVIQMTAVGNFTGVAGAGNPQWLLFMPSIHLFAMYDAYVHAVEGNKLFDAEQNQYMKENYQDSRFTLPV